MADERSEEGTTSKRSALAAIRSNAGLAVTGQLPYVGSPRLGQRAYWLPKLKHIAVVVIDRELAHAVIEVLDSVRDPSLVSQQVPQGIHVIGTEIERSGKPRRYVKGRAKAIGTYFSSPPLPKAPLTIPV